MCAGVCVCNYVCMYALRIVAMDKTLRYKDSLIIMLLCELWRENKSETRITVSVLKQDPNI